MISKINKETMKPSGVESRWSFVKLFISEHLWLNFNIAGKPTGKPRYGDIVTNDSVEFGFFMEDELKL